MKSISRLVLLACLSAPVAPGQTQPKSLIYSGNYDTNTGTFDSLTFVNSVVGWDTFFNAGFRGGSTVIGNVEGGTVWFGHEVFTRPPGAPSAFTTYQNTATGAVNELDFHATMVGHMLAGSGYIPDNGGSYTYVGLGMAPEAKLVSGGIATGFSSTDLGSFSTTHESVVNAYSDFFEGTNLGSGVAKPDVINSSWGGDDPAAVSDEIVSIDGLARQNSSTAFVVSAGNGGAAQVSAPASGYNNISVGSLGGPTFHQPSSFSSSGLVDFYNPVTNQTLTGVRAAVDIAAPGERMFLAAYLGKTGSLGAALPGITQNPPPTDQYFVNNDGTSFAAPIVAGGISLLKDAAKTDLFNNYLGNSNAFDTRVIKSVLMASADKTEGWNNGQNAMNVTTQALDAKTGAGMMNLSTAASVYFFGTRELAADGGGSIESKGWDSATIGRGNAYDYLFSASFTQPTELSVALNWFSDRAFSDITQSGTDVAFANLDLQVWSVDGTGQFVSMVGESDSIYNNTEFLRIDALNAGRYGLRVLFKDMVYDTTNSVNSEYYGLAWNAVAVPEPTALCLLAGAAAVFTVRKRR